MEDFNQTINANIVLTSLGVCFLLMYVFSHFKNKFWMHVVVNICCKEQVKPAQPLMTEFKHSSF